MTMQTAVSCQDTVDGRQDAAMLRVHLGGRLSERMSLKACSLWLLGERAGALGPGSQGREMAIVILGFGIAASLQRKTAMHTHCRHGCPAARHKSQVSSKESAWMDLHRHQRRSRPELWAAQPALPKRRRLWAPAKISLHGWNPARTFCSYAMPCHAIAVAIRRRCLDSYVLNCCSIEGLETTFRPASERVP
jgi:hypothetical protein